MTTVFNQMAQTYDTPQRKALAEIILKEVSPAFKDATNKTLLDYGGGTGLVSLPLAPLVKQVELLDLASEMSQLANQKAQNQGIKNFTAFQGDLLGEHPVLATPDMALLSLVLLHIPDTQAILAKLFQVLAPGGTLLLVDFNHNELVQHPLVHSGFDLKELEDVLVSIGFTNVVAKTFYEADHLFMNQPASLFHLQGTKPQL